MLGVGHRPDSADSAIVMDCSSYFLVVNVCLLLSDFIILCENMIGAWVIIVFYLSL